MRTSAILIVLGLMTSAAPAEILPSSASWSVEPPFGKGSAARQALSGVTCVADTKRCIVVNDEKKYAQFFSIHPQQLVPEDVIRLLPDDIDGVEMKEIDAEGVAYSAPAGLKIAHLYVVGSHGLSRKKGSFQPSRFFLFRFAVDSSTGLPTFDFGDEYPEPAIERTSLLRDTLRNDPVIGSYAEQKLDRNGVVIEGVAGLGENILLGLRSPCIVNAGVAHAQLLRLPANELFKDKPPSATRIGLPLGDNVGVRDLAAVEGGVLILAGRSDDDRGDGRYTCGEMRAPPRPLPSVWFWDGESDNARSFGPLPGVDAGDSAEGLVVLDETDGVYRVLVLFDGIENGGPVEFVIEK
jgi:hypothetical protein